MMKLKEKLTEERKKKQISQIDLAAYLGVSRQVVSRWEMGAGKPSIDNLRALSKLYGVPLDYLLDEDTPSRHPDSLAPSEPWQIPLPQAEEECPEQKPEKRKLNRKKKVLWVVLALAALFTMTVAIVVADRMYLKWKEREEGKRAWSLDEVETEPWDFDEDETVHLTW